MKTRRFEFLLEAVQPIAHHEGTIGNHATVMRRKVRLADGEFAEVPVITGDTMRHGLREAATWALLDAAGLDEARLSDAALRLLFNGGVMTGRGDAGSVNLDQYRELATIIPPLALFGGCAMNRPIPGRIVVEDAVVLCQETMRWLAPWAVTLLEGQSFAMARGYVEETQRVRMDATLDPSKRRLLSDGAQVAVNARLAASEAAHVADDAIARDESKSTMLPRTFERVVQGALFTWAIQAETYTELDDDTLLTTLGVFLSRPRVGGKKGTGHGELRVVAARDIGVRRPSERAEVLDCTELGPRVGEVFRAHCAARADEIGKFLAKVDA